MEQLNLFDIIPFDYCLKTKEQNDIDLLVRKGSGFVKGKLRILAYYNLTTPTMSDFAKFLGNEYGCGGCSNSAYSERHNSSGIEIYFKSSGQSYKFNWAQFAKLVAKSIENDEYINEKDIPKTEFFEARENHGNYTHLVKTYQISQTYDGKKIINAYLSSCTQEQVTGMVELYSCRNSHVDIGIHELINAIETGIYDSEIEIWEDINRNLRRISQSVFGGKKFLDENGVREFLSYYKKQGYVFSKKDKEEIDHRNTFYDLRRRVKSGEISAEFLKKY